MSRNSRVRDRGYISSHVSIPAATYDNFIAVDYLVVAGGAGGGGGGEYASHRTGAGGGAGGMRSTVTATGGSGSLETALSLSLGANVFERWKKPSMPTGSQ